MIEIDGAHGEGGGQVLRTTLTLAMLNNTPVKIKNIRAKRPKPGLMRQHLACVKASQEISNAAVQGAYLGSTELVFIPNEISAGNYEFDIGSAGSTTLVFQTILLPLFSASGESRVRFKGGTHNPMAPSLTCIKYGFIPLIYKMGGIVELDVKQWGYAPIGGGDWSIKIQPSCLSPLKLIKQGKLIDSRVRCYLSNIKSSVAERELSAYKKSCKTNIEILDQEFPKAVSTGNLLSHRLVFDDYQTCMSILGRQRVAAETVAKELASQVDEYMSSGCTLNSFLADQMMLPLFVAGAGEYSTSEITLHAETNIWTIKKMTGKELKRSEIHGRKIISF